MPAGTPKTEAKEKPEKTHADTFKSEKNVKTTYTHLRLPRQYPFFSPFLQIKNRNFVAAQKKKSHKIALFKLFTESFHGIAHKNT